MKNTYHRANTLLPRKATVNRLLKFSQNLAVVRTGKVTAVFSKN